MARLFAIKPTMTIRGRKFKGLRGWAGKPTHPPLTDIPVAAYILAAVFDILSYVGHEYLDWKAAPRDLFAAATYAMIAGLVVSIPTALTGFWDWLKSTPKHTQAWRTANWHMAVMLTVTVLVALNIVLRLSEYDATIAAGFGLALYTAIVALLVSFGAAYGGALVYEYGFNVEQGFDHAWEKSEVDKLPGEH
jgi:uncharacterized membrane protein